MPYDNLPLIAHTPDRSVFFTIALARRGDDLLLREIERLRQAVRITRSERPFVINAWVVLPDHLHAIWTLPAQDSDHAARWRLIKSRFSAGLPKGKARIRPGDRPKPGLWHERSCIHPLRSADDHAAHVRFCWTDPVKHGLVDDPGDWPYSSFNQQPMQRTG